ncbi:MAG: hypothetical protein ACOX6L_11790 [Syntrophomonadaceae bacterium]|jgi:MFS family permease
MEVWFSENVASVLGAVFGGMGGLLGAFGAFIAIVSPKGKFRKLVLATTIIIICIGAGLLITGIYALLSKQPYFVWYPFVLIGAIIILVLLPNYFFIKRRYTQIELKKMGLQDAFKLLS